MKKTRVIVIGAGDRGNIYASYSMSREGSEKLEIIGVCEPNIARREAFALKYSLEENIFENYQELFRQEKIADAVFICTQDKDHFEPLKLAIGKGYDVLVEKPVITTPEEYEQIISVLKNSKNKICIAHVLRYTKFFREIKKLVDEKAIGEVRSISHFEDIGFYHFAHSYVRGNWSQERKSSPIILAKCCHDLDILNWILDSFPKKISSQGTINFFNKQNRPEKASLRCHDCPLINDCEFSAFKIYSKKKGWVHKIGVEEYGSVEAALINGPYGRCVFSSDNDVCSYQSVHMVYPNDIQVHFEMNSLSSEITRKIRIFGTKGEIEGDFRENKIYVKNFWEKKEEISLGEYEKGHGGGDFNCVEEFIKLVNAEIEQQNNLEILNSHHMAFLAEKSRKEERIINTRW